MKTKESIEQLFKNLEIWIGLPKYQAERRLDVFFGLYLDFSTDGVKVFP